MSAGRGCAIGTSCFGHPDCEDRQCPGHPDNTGGNGARWRLEQLQRQDEQASESEALMRALVHALAMVAIAAVAGELLAAILSGARP